MVYVNRTRENGFKQEEERFRLDIRKKIHYKVNEALAQLVQRVGECPIHGDTQSQSGRGTEHLMEL